MLTWHMYYQRSKGLFDPKSKEPFKISRSKIDLFTQCPRCFYMDTKLGLGRPSTPPYTLNNAVDSLLKNELDLLRKSGQKYKLAEEYKIDAVPFEHQDLPKWRGEVVAYEGALALDEKSNILVNGLVDDIWQNPKGDLVIVDYKATSTTKKISLDDEYKQAYKRQMEIYQWIFRKLGFSVSNIGYFIFANAKKDRDNFDGRLEFEMSIHEHKGVDSWVNLTLLEIKECLMSDALPMPAPDCDYCTYRQRSVQAARNLSTKSI